MRLTYIDRYNPMFLMNDKSIQKICSGGHCSMIYKDNGDLFDFWS